MSNRAIPGYASMMSEEKTLKPKAQFTKDDGMFRRTMDRLS
jgi:hypothetical protein